MSDSHIEPESTYPALEKPKFTSDIPPHLLAGINDSEKWILEQLSVTKQFIDWSVEAQLLTHSSVRRTNGRLIAVEENLGEVKVKDLQRFKDRLLSWWALGSAVIVIVGAIAGIVEIIQYLQSLGK